MTYVSRAVIALVLVAGLSSTAFGQNTPRPVRKGRKYTVKIDSSPQQATIYLDDKQYGIVGYTPWSGKLVKGDYKLIIEMPGFKPVEKMITVDRKSKSFMEVLQKQAQPGKIDVQATADPNVNGATVWVDGLSEGTAPIEIEVRDGRHQVEIKKPGFEDFTQWVNVTEGRVVTITPVLKAVVVAKPKGSLLVDADVADAEVYLNGKLQPDTTPTLIDNLDEGEYIVEVKKAPATPWKQTVFVTGGKRTKVTAMLAATMSTSKKGGTVRVLSNVPNTEVYLDGVQKGTAPIDLTDIEPGEHLIEVKAKGYNPQSRRVKVNVGSAELATFEMVAITTTTTTTGKIKVVSPVPEAKVFIDGANVGTAPIEREVSAGEHFVVVEQTGYAKFEQKVAVEAGQTITITAQLRAIGTLRFLSSPEGADIKLDGEIIGKTPLVKEDVDVGRHVVELHLEGYLDYENDEVVVEGGKIGIVNAQLEQIILGPSEGDLIRLKWGLSSYGARVMPFRRFTVDVGSGFPYLFEARATVGVADEKRYGWDVGVGFRTLGTNWEFLGTVRYRYFQKDPFAFAGFVTLGGGGGFDGRNSFLVQAGLLNTITFQGNSGYAVTITGRAYLDMWSDRLCGLDDNDMPLTDGVPAVCNAVMGSPELEEGRRLTGNEDMQDRDLGARVMLSFIAEAAVHEKFSLYLVFEGAPFQSERAAHTDLFNSPMLEEDPIYNGKIGATLKF